jgi:predicted nucleic acid-binding protein
MILIDTSIWADHFNRPSDDLNSIVRSRRVLIHPFVIGELAAGNLHPWESSVSALRALPTSAVATDDEYYTFLFDRKLMGSGLSFVDIHLLASANRDNCPLWTRDKRLSAKADELDCLYVI